MSSRGAASRPPVATHAARRARVPPAPATSLCDLPVEVIGAHVCPFLAPADVGVLIMTCTAMRAAASSDVVWAPFCEGLKALKAAPAAGAASKLAVYRAHVLAAARRAVSALAGEAARSIGAGRWPSEAHARAVARLDLCELSLRVGRAEVAVLVPGLLRRGARTFAAERGGGSGRLAARRDTDWAYCVSDGACGALVFVDPPLGARRGDVDRLELEATSRLLGRRRALVRIAAALAARAWPPPLAAPGCDVALHHFGAAALEGGGGAGVGAAAGAPPRASARAESAPAPPRAGADGGAGGVAARGAPVDVGSAVTVATYVHGDGLAWLCVHLPYPAQLARFLTPRSAPAVLHAPVADDLDARLGTHGFTISVALRSLAEVLWHHCFRGVDGAVADDGGVLLRPDLRVVSSADTRVAGGALDTAWATQTLAGTMRQVVVLEVVVYDEFAAACWTCCRFVRVAEAGARGRGVSFAAEGVEEELMAAFGDANVRARARARCDGWDARPRSCASHAHFGGAQGSASVAVAASGGVAARQLDVTWVECRLSRDHWGRWFGRAVGAGAK